MTKQDLYVMFAFTLIGSFLRLARFYDFVTYLGDQGRDAIIIKRILNLTHFPAIGASTSVGQVYLGPFYYYFIAPWLLLTNYNPVGLALGVAFFSILFIPISYLIIKNLTDKKIAFFSTLLLAFSSTMIDFSRFSWNPNLLPASTLLFVFFLFKSFEKKRLIYFTLTGIFLSISIQLHALALLLIPLGIIYFLAQTKNKTLRSETFIKGSLTTLVSLVIFSAPLIIFDLRHEFLNTRSFIKLFTAGGGAIGIEKFTSVFNTFRTLNNFVFDTNFNLFSSSALLIGILITALFLFKKSAGYIRYFFASFLLLLIGLNLYSGPKYIHYFGVVYPFYFIVIAYFLANLSTNLGGKLLVLLFILTFTFFNSRQYYFLYLKGHSQIERAKTIAKVIYDNVDTSYSLTSLPTLSSESMYRYFLEIWKKKPIEKDSLEKTKELFVVCEELCKPIGNPQWDIAYFAPNKIDRIWNVENVTIYKLSR